MSIASFILYLATAIVVVVIAGIILYRNTAYMDDQQL